MSPEQLPSKIGKSVGEKLRAARIAQHYTQSQLAAPDFSVSYISAIERGQIHPSLRALEILAGRLGLSSTQLLPNRSQPDARLNSSVSISERDDDEIELALLEAQILIRQGDAATALLQLGKLSTKRLKRQQQLQHRYLLGWANFGASHFQECEYTLSEALQLAKEQNANYLSSRILNLSALAHAAMRNYSQALLTHQRCLNLLETTEPYDPFFTAQVYMHMGHYYTLLENFVLAIEMFNKALVTTNELNSTPAVQTVYQNICRYFAENKEYSLASLHAYKSLHLSNLLTLKRLRGELYHYLGYALLKYDTVKARTFFDETLQQNGLARDPLALASIMTSSALEHFSHNAFGTAREEAGKAVEIAQPFGDTIVAASALIALGHAEYADKSYEAGDEHLSAGLDILERLGSHEELADESVQYAQLLEERGREREAFTYFRRAFQSSQKIGK